MKRFVKYIVLLVLLIGGATFGIVRYLHSKDQGHATEVAADAIGDAADAVAAWARDKTPRHVDVLAYFGEGPVGGHVGLFAVRATVTAVGAGHLSEVCAGMPVVRDALNTVLFDRVHKALDERRPLDASALAAYAPAVETEINRAFNEKVVDQVQLALAAPSPLNDTGCKAERAASRK